MKKLYPILALFFLLQSCSSTKKQAINSWEKEILALEQKDKNEPDPQDGILFIGSSSIRLWDGIHNDMKPYTVIQRGYGGAKFSDLQYFVKRLSLNHHPRAIVFFIANDILGLPNDKSPEEVLSLYKKIVKTERKLFAQTPIFLIGITPTPSRFKVWYKAKQANTLLQHYSNSRPNLFFVDTEKGFLDEKGQPRPEYFISDQLHLNTDGYVVWSKYVKEALNRIF